MLVATTGPLHKCPHVQSTKVCCSRGDRKVFLPSSYQDRRDPTATPAAAGTAANPVAAGTAAKPVAAGKCQLLLVLKWDPHGFALAQEAHQLALAGGGTDNEPARQGSARAKRATEESKDGEQKKSKDTKMHDKR
jgi:hypothetical protein